MGSFCGFSSEMFDFLLALHDNNTVGAQNENIVLYKKLITLPLTDLYETLLPTMIAISDDIETSPHRSISSPYTDRRFSPLIPLKEYMYLRFKVGGREKDIPDFILIWVVNFFHTGSVFISRLQQEWKICAQNGWRIQKNIFRLLNVFPNRDFLFLGIFL